MLARGDFMVISEIAEAWNRGLTSNSRRGAGSDFENLAE
jgi:hypothetical protein